MINKKAQLNWVMMGGVLLALLIVISFYNSNIKGNELVIECEDYELILESINGMRDQDSGFFSGGTTEQKNLLFENGLLLTFDDYDLKGIDLYIGGKYYIEKCSEINSVSKHMDGIDYKINLIKQVDE